MIYNKYNFIYLFKYYLKIIGFSIRKFPKKKNKGILLLVFFLFCTLTFVSVPQQANAIVFNDIAEWGRNAAQKIAQNQQKIVVRYFSQYNPAFAYLCYCAQVFAIIPVGVGFMRWLREDEDLKIWIELVAPFMVLIGLQNGGYILGQIIFALYQIFDGIINTFDSYTGFYQVIKEGKARTLITPSLSPLFKQCEALIGVEQSACFANLSKQALKMIDEYKQDFFNASWLQDWTTRLTDLSTKLLDPKTNVEDKFRTTFWTLTSPAWEGILAVILVKVMEAWQALYGIAFTMCGIASPMAATASLFTSNTFLASAYAAWLTGMFTIFLARLLLYIGYGFASDIVVSADASTDVIWFGILMAFILPFCVFAIAKGSAVGVWTSLIGTSSATIAAATMLTKAGPAGTALANQISVQGSAPAQQRNAPVETRY